MNVMGIIFANKTSKTDVKTNMGTLGDKRTMASLPFGGRYRQIDFHLSNMAAAGIRHIGILSRHNYQSLMNHVGSGEEWGLELGEGGLEYLTPYATGSGESHLGKLDYLNSAMDFLSYGPEDEYVVLTDASVLCNMDMDKLLEAHVASGKDLTVVAKAGIADGARCIDLALKLDDAGEIADIAVDYMAPADYLASMDIFVASKKWLINTIHKLVTRGRYHMDRDLVMGQWQNHEASIHVYPYTDPAMFTGDALEYYRNNMALIDRDIRQHFFGGNHLVFTKVRDRVPSYYGENCEIDNCIVADGCMLDGAAKNSVLFRQVTLGEGAKLDSCIVMNDTVIGEGAELRYVILDKDVTVRPGARLAGTPTNPILIKKGGLV